MTVSGTSAVAESLRRIAVDTDGLLAWAYVNEHAGNATPGDGPLTGVPFGVKDIIDVAGLPTGYGLARESRISERDAWCVATLRAAGAVPIGKTHTTACAHRDPAPTYNPLDRSRTPGGSSAGSAAAVGAGQVPFALGTQTIGSVLRPAAYCGVVGFKPTYGRIPTNGVAPLAPSLDHVGIIAIDVAMTRRVARCAIPSLGDATASTRPRLAIADTLWSKTHAPETLVAVRRAIDALEQYGIAVELRPMPAEAGAALDDAHLINAFEAYAVLAPLLGATLPPQVEQLLRRGEDVDRGEYVAALARREAARPRIDDFLADFDAVIVPCGDAAPSRATTGDGTPFGPWSYFGTPSVSIPIPNTAPAAVSLQLTASSGKDALLLATAAVVEAALRDR